MMRRLVLLYVTPTLLCLGAANAALIFGAGTLYDRDVLNHHYPLKAVQASLMDAGRLPLIDPYRSGGQPLVGNLNALPLYPDNLLYAVAPPLWALNAHFWLHLLLAPMAGYWLGRAWGLSRQAAWATGAIYATSGFFLSLMSFYNLITGATLAPAFIAACLNACSNRRRGSSLLWVGGLWALLILGGDPIFGLLALLMAAGACLARHRGLPPGGGWLMTAGLLGTLIALPQIVELLRILPSSFRGHVGYSLDKTLAYSWDPRTGIEWLIPFFFGPPDLSFWGFSFFEGQLPLFDSLYPGVLTLCLLWVAGRPRTALTWWGWSTVALGAFLALGFWNPLIRSASEILPGSSLMRFPIKCWLLVAIAGSVLCGRGFERVLRGERRRRLTVLLAAAIVLFSVCSWAFTRGPAWFLAGLARLDPELRVPGNLGQLRPYWSRQCASSLVLVVVLAMAIYLMRRSRHGGGAVLLAAHVAGQLFLLQPLVDTDSADFYTGPPLLVETIPRDARVVHGNEQNTFGQPPVIPGNLPDASRAWLQRGCYAELYPSGGIPWGLRYELTTSPEGLDTYALFAVSWKFLQLSDAARLRMLAAIGVDRLVLERSLALDAEPQARLLAAVPRDGKTLRLYEVLGSAPEVMLAGAVRFASDLDAGIARITDPSFDPMQHVVVYGEGAAREAPRGSVEVLLDDVERLEVAVDSAEGGTLLTQRAHLPIYRATIDDAPAPIEMVNLQRLGVQIPPGRHRVRLWVDRRPFYLASAVALLAVAGLALLAAGRARSERTGKPASPAGARKSGGSV